MIRPTDPRVRDVKFFEDATDFSLSLGGPLYQLLLGVRLLRPPLALLTRRVIVLPLLAWLPLCVLALAGRAGHGAQVPFLFDLDAHARFLVAIPLLLIAEVIVHQRLRPLVLQFLERGLVASEDRARFGAIVASAMRLRNSIVLEVLLIVAVYSAGHWLWLEHTRLSVVTWFALPVDGRPRLTIAGYWYAFVSLPFFQFLLVRWYFRLFIWCRFLFQVSRLPLRLNALHPDRAGGLGFLAGSAPAFGPLLMAHTVPISAIIANRIWHQGATLPEFKTVIGGLVLFLMLLVLAPLMLFAGHLAAARRAAVREYGVVATRYVGDFRAKWIDGKAPDGEPLLGSGDIQSLADLGNSFAVVREMGTLPFGRDTVVQLAVTIALPLMPLALTVVPLEEIVKWLIDILL